MTWREAIISCVKRLGAGVYGYAPVYDRDNQSHWIEVQSTNPNDSPTLVSESHSPFCAALEPYTLQKKKEIKQEAKQENKPLNSVVADLFIEKARRAIEQWDGVCTADLFIEVLEQTGEDKKTIIESALRRI